MDEIKRLAIETPGKIAVLPDATAATERQLLAGADVLLLADKDNYLARTAGVALCYGTLPLVPDCAAYADYMVDYDVASQTGNGLLCATLGGHRSAIREHLPYDASRFVRRTARPPSMAVI